LSKVQVFIDTEFTDFVGSQLISLGAVTFDGKQEFYVELTDYNKKLSSEFVRRVIEPMLDPVQYGKTMIQASASLWCWLEELGPCEICCDYLGDWELMCKLLDGLPPNVAPQPVMIWPELNKLAIAQAHVLQQPDWHWYYEQCKLAFLNGQREWFLRNKGRVHHALDDAKANAAGWQAVQQCFIKGYY
jgi:DNA polymerase III epsilon subunit-like protein